MNTLTEVQLDKLAREMAKRINSRRSDDSNPPAFPEDAARRRYVRYVGWSRVPSTGQRFRGTCGR